MNLQDFLSVEIQFTGLVVCFTKKRVLFFKESGQSVPLERLILLRNFCGSLAIPNCLGVTKQEEGARPSKIVAFEIGDGIEIGDGCYSSSRRSSARGLLMALCRRDSPIANKHFSKLL